MAALPDHAPRWVRGWVLALAGTVLACGTAPPRPTAPAPVPGAETVRVEPLAFGPRARARNHALILGTTDAGATWLPLAEPATTVGIQADDLHLPAADSAARPASGPLWITAWVRPVPGARAAGLANAGLVTDGDRARRLPAHPAAGAALQATALALGKDLSDLRYVAVPEATLTPLAREPMAGALLAAALLASLTGAPVAPDAAREAHAAREATMAGMLLPDGSVLAPTAGGVRDVHQAYARLTGRRLPAPVPVPARAMAVPAAWAARLGAPYPAWRRALAGSWMQVLDMTGAARQPPALAHLAREAERLAREAEVLRGRGALLMALEHMMTAATYATAAAALQTMLVGLRAGHDGAGEPLRALGIAAAERLDQARAAAAAASSSSTGEQVLVMAAHQWILRGAGAHATGSQGQAALERALDATAAGADSPLSARAERLIAAAAPAALALARAESSARRALDMVAAAPQAPAPCATGHATGGPAGVAPGKAADPIGPIGAVALAHAAATAAGLPPGDTGDTGDDVHAAVARVAVEHAQRWARADRALAPATRCDRARAALAAALLAQVEAALSALPRHLPANSAARARVLADLLARAERKARQHARAAQVATGDIPALARLEYTMARRLARPAAAGAPSQAGDFGTAADAAMLAALERFWLSSMHAQAAVILARHWATR